MQVRFMDRTYDYSNDTASMERLLAEIGNVLADPQLVLAGMIIDGHEVYDNYSEYIEGRIDKIKTIEVVFDTIENTIDDMLRSMSRYLDRAIPELETLSNDFYTGEVEDIGIEKLGQLAEGIHWIVDIISYINTNKALHSILKNSNVWDECISSAARLKEEFGNYKAAIGNMDIILIADILKYEVIDIFTALNHSIRQIYGHGVEENAN